MLDTRRFQEIRKELRYQHDLVLESADSATAAAIYTVGEKIVEAIEESTAQLHEMIGARTR